MAAFLLELRTEEIPANALPGARRQLADGLSRTLAEADQRLKRTGMPGRLVLEAAVIRICGPQGAGPSAEAR